MKVNDGMLVFVGVIFIIGWVMMTKVMLIITGVIVVGLLGLVVYVLAFQPAWHKKLREVYMSSYNKKKDETAKKKETENVTVVADAAVVAEEVLENIPK